ncbi:LexA family protein [Pseudomonas leptonychotis]|uniref:LexA family protein n=1 Tax=Pseudomonas leptonychotis TaxID=2448482 RepID=UPI003866D38E
MTIDYLGRLSFGGVLYPYFAFRVPAGFPSPAQDHLEQEISLDELFNLRAPHTYLVKVVGDSMVLAGIYDGDLLIVDRSREAKHGDIVIAALSNEPLVKRFCREGGLLVLRSENTKYSPRYVMESDELSIWGVVRFSVRCHDVA